MTTENIKNPIENLEDALNELAIDVSNPERFKADIIESLIKRGKQVPYNSAIIAIDYYLSLDCEATAANIAKKVHLTEKERENIVGSLTGKRTWTFMGDLAFYLDLEDVARDCYKKAMDAWERKEGIRALSEQPCRLDGEDRDYLRLPNIDKVIKLGLASRLLPIAEENIQMDYKYIKYHVSDIIRLADAAGMKEKSIAYHKQEFKRLLSEPRGPKDEWILRWEPWLLSAAQHAIKAGESEEARKIYHNVLAKFDRLTLRDRDYRDCGMCEDLIRLAAEFGDQVTIKRLSPIIRNYYPNGHYSDAAEFAKLSGDTTAAREYLQKDYTGKINNIISKISDPILNLIETSKIAEQLGLERKIDALEFLRKQFG